MRWPSCLAALSLATWAQAATIVVPPGSGTLQAAIDVATPGSTLKLTEGPYLGAVTVTKPLRIVGPRYGNAAIVDAECVAAVALAVAADHVALRDVRVIRGAEVAIDVTGRDRVLLRDVEVSNSRSPGNACVDVDYGVRVTASTRVKVSGITMYSPFDGFSEAAVALRQIAAKARVSVERGIVTTSARGIVVADVQPGAVRVANNDLVANDVGILLQNADGVLVQRNRVRSGRAQPAGIVVDAASDDNLLQRNAVDGYVADVVDDGSSNCWAGTSFTTGSVPPGGCD